MTNATLFRWTCHTVVALSMILPAPGSAAEPQVQITDHPVDRRLVIAITMPSGTMPSEGDVARIVRLPAGLMLHRFNIEAPASATLAGVQVMIVALGDHGAAHLAVLDEHHPALDLPRPLGFLLERGDSLQVDVRWAGEASALVELHIVLHYERPERPRNRLAVIPVRAAAAATDNPTTQSWEWIAPVSGRIISLAGLRPLSSGELILVDVESGAVLWREMFQPADGEAFACGSGVVRAGAQVLEGRKYRLLAVGTGQSVLAMTGLVQALLLPG